MIWIARVGSARLRYSAAVWAVVEEDSSSSRERAKSEDVASPWAMALNLRLGVQPRMHTL